MDAVETTLEVEMDMHRKQEIRQTKKLPQSVLDIRDHQDLKL